MAEKIRRVTEEDFNKVIKEEKEFLKRQIKLFKEDYKNCKINQRKYNKLRQLVKNDLLEVELIVEIELIEKKVINGFACRRSTGNPSKLKQGGGELTQKPTNKIHQN